ncbi:winged helix DNA-binding domain-containing protein [Meredithblackwellia eburnea MCA 4105]
MMPGPSKIKPFISKLTALLSEPELYRDCLVWDQTGSSFILSHSNPRFLHDVLPKSFGHSNLQSFTRQLNVYDFKRLPLPELLEKLDLGPTASTVEYSGWYHPSFKRDDVSLLATMTPRPSRARLQKKIEKQERLEKQRRDAVEQHQSQLQQQAMQHQQQHLSHPHLPHPGYQNTYHQPPGPPR